MNKLFYLLGMFLLLIMASCSLFRHGSYQPQNPQPVDTANYHFQTDIDSVRKGRNTITITSNTTTAKKPIEANLKKDTTIKADSTGSDASKWDCYTRTVNITAQSSTFMNADYASQGQYIYPGAIYAYSEFKKANYKEINVPRNPIVLTSDNPNIIGTTSVTVKNPGMPAIREGIANLYSRFDNKDVGTMNLRYQTYESNSEAELSLRLSGGASYSGFTIENEFKNEVKTTHHYITIDVIKPLFTINAILPDSLRFFKSPLTGIKNPIIISSVTYGIRVLANFDLDTKTQDEFDKFRAKYNSITSSAHLDLDYIVKNSNTEQTINCYVVGGPGNSTVSFDKADLETKIKDLVAGVKYSSARPISYTLTDLLGNIIETNSATDDIKNQVCVPHIDEPELQAAIVEMQCGDDGKDGDTRYSIILRKGISSDFGNNVVASFGGDNGDINYPPNNSILRAMTLQGTTKPFDFINNNGGSILIHVEPNGSDTWKMNRFILKLIFKNGRVENVEFNKNFEVSDDSKDYYLFFNKDFKML